MREMGVTRRAVWRTGPTRDEADSSGDALLKVIMDGVRGQIGAIRPDNRAEFINLNTGEGGPVPEGLEDRAKEPFGQIDPAFHAVLETHP